MKKNNQRIIFDLPEDGALTDAIDQILRNNGLQESDEDFFSKDIRGDEPMAIIVRDAAITMVQRRISDGKLIELLAKHLKTSQDTAKNIAKNIGENLAPFAKVIDPKEEKTEYNKENFQKELLDKIRGNQPEPEPKEIELPEPNIKKIPITDVEKNAQNMEAEGKNMKTESRNPAEKLEPASAESSGVAKEKPQEKPADPYKEIPE